MQRTEIDVHGFVKLSIDSDFPWAEAWLEPLRDLKVVSPIHSSSTVELRVQYSDIDPTGLRYVGHNLLIGKHAVLDSKYRVQLGRDDDDVLSVYTDRPAVEWLIWLLQLGLLTAGATFIHAAAVEHNGHALLFPSWGGVGKTALVQKFVQQSGYRLLGDDLAIIDGSSQCYGFPKPMVLYAYHNAVFPDVFSSGRGPTAPAFLNNLLSRLAIRLKPVLRMVPGVLQFARTHNPQSVQILPSEVFGPEKLAANAAARAVVWLERLKGLTEVEICPGKHTLPARIMGSTLNEIDQRCIRTTNVAMGVGIVKLDDFYDSWSRVLSQALSDVPQYVVYLPESMPIQDMPDAVWQALEAVGVRI